MYKIILLEAERDMKKRNIFMQFGKANKIKKLEKIANQLDKLKKEERQLKIKFTRSKNKNKIKKKIVEVSRQRQYLNLLLALMAGIITPIAFKKAAYYLLPDYMYDSL